MRVPDPAADTAGLQAQDVGGRHAPGEERVLRELLEMPAADRAAMQVDRGAEQDVDVFAARLAGEQLAQFAHEVLVPACRDRSGARQAGRRLVVGHGAAFDAGGTVGDEHASKPGLGSGVDRPEVDAGQQADLRFEVQSCERVFDRNFDARDVVGHCRQIRARFDHLHAESPVL